MAEIVPSVKTRERRDIDVINGKFKWTKKKTKELQ